LKPLVGDRQGVDYRRVIVDLETAGFGRPGERPEQLLACTFDGSAYADYWGRRWGGGAEGPMVDVIQEMIDDGEPFELMGHFAGNFDFKFANEWLFGKMRAKAEVVTAGSNVLCVAGKVRGVPFRLVDTIRLLLTSLKKIGKWLGRLKGTVLHKHHAVRCRGPLPKRCGACLCRTAEGRERLAVYCRQDCGILWDAVAYVERLVGKVRGIRARTTLASTSTACIRATLTEKTVAECELQVDLDAEGATYGGLVEPHAEECGEAELDDVRSMYPWAMSAGPLPWRHRVETKRYREGELGFAEIDVEVPEGCKLPILPYRVTEGPEAGRLYFPTGRWRGSFVCEELDAAVRLGAARIVKCYRQHRFSGSNVMGDFAREVWQWRESSEGFERQFWKIFINSAYGKLVERREKRRYVANPESAEGLTCVSAKYGLHFREVVYQPGFRHVVAGATITARARVRLRAIMAEVLRQGGRLYYCDTDSVVFSGAALPLGDGLGELDRQYKIKRGLFAAAKFYVLWVEGEDGKVRVVKKAKGLPRMTLRDTLRAMRGLPVKVSRTMGFRESLARAGTPGYERVEFVKQHHFGRPKRAEKGARPWSVRELGQAWVQA